MSKQTAIIIGAGPAGLTAAHELLTRTDIQPIVLEMSGHMGGIARTVNYRGNRIDIGGHRFFSKSDRVMQWWFDRMPLQATDKLLQRIQYQGKSRLVSATREGPDPDLTDRVMLARPRRSRIYYQREFFDYPISLSLDTIRKLGLWRVLKIGLSYARSVLSPIRNETTLEDFFINRFGRELYRTFFETYTQKVWGRPCSAINAEWGAQRVKGLSITKALLHALKKPFQSRGVGQKGVETSLIEQFLYPKYGPGQMWETVAGEVEDMGGRVLTGMQVRRIDTAGRRATTVEAVDVETGESHTFQADYVFSSMPVKQLVRSVAAKVSEELRQIGEGLVYRDFLTVGLLVDELKVKEDTGEGQGLIRDNWIYIQESDVTVGRMQIFNNWSPYMVADPSKVWIGLEYFCDEHDDLWVKADRELITLATSELAKIGIIEPTAVRDGTVIKMPKAYPAYFGTYEEFGELQSWIDGFENLFLIGRNGMHRYNNMDHSMLTAMVAVDNIIEGRTDKSNIWAVNAEREYHEVGNAKAADAKQPGPSSVSACTASTSGTNGAHEPDTDTSQIESLAVDQPVTNVRE
jgi:protoporphyrinogen oxidase